MSHSTAYLSTERRRTSVLLSSKKGVGRSNALNIAQRSICSSSYRIMVMILLMYSITTVLLMVWSEKKFTITTLYSPLQEEMNTKNNKQTVSNTQIIFTPAQQETPAEDVQPTSLRSRKDDVSPYFNLYDVLQAEDNLPSESCVNCLEKMSCTSCSTQCKGFCEHLCKTKYLSIMFQIHPIMGTRMMGRISCHHSH